MTIYFFVFVAVTGTVCGGFKAGGSDDFDDGGARRYFGVSSSFHRSRRNEAGAEVRRKIVLLEFGG